MLTVKSFLSPFFRKFTSSRFMRRDVKEKYYFNENMEESLNTLTKYHAPEWCGDLQGSPNFRIPLVTKKTPIHPWNIREIPRDFKLSVKRDDMNGSALNGNKARNLEFLLADAITKGCSSVITYGTTFSNHCRSTLVACRQLGLNCHLIMKCLNKDYKESSHFYPPSNGNLLLSQIGHPEIYLVPWDDFSDKVLDEKSHDLADYLLKTTGEKSYCIPAGGTTDISLHGYFYAWEEMIQQGVLDNFDDIVVTCGSGGTSRALAIANYLTGSKVRIHAFCVTRSSDEIHHKMQKTLKKIGLANVHPRDILDLCENYLGGGFGSHAENGIEFCGKIAETTGVYCDPYYVGKSLQGLVNELHTNPDRFKGNRILFIHTGGLFVMMENEVAQMFQTTMKRPVRTWSELEQCRAQV